VSRDGAGPKGFFSFTSHTDPQGLLTVRLPTKLERALKKKPLFLLQEGSVPLVVLWGFSLYDAA
jgi:hypothetical protein